MGDKPNLSPGQSSDWVRYLQSMINHYYQQSVVPESGEFDGTTADTVRYLRQQSGLRDTADVDGEVWAVLDGQSGGSDYGGGGGQFGGGGSSDSWDEAEATGPGPAVSAILTYDGKWLSTKGVTTGWPRGKIWIHGDLRRDGSFEKELEHECDPSTSCELPTWSREDPAPGHWVFHVTATGPRYPVVTASDELDVP
jgi:hypothetical protein